jgi:hypothetical protein
MIAPGLTDTRVELLRGEALVEATDLHKENNVCILDHGLSATLLKNGLYAFDADTPGVSVYDGKAEVQFTDSKATVTEGKQVLPAEPLKAVKFDRGQKDALYQWSNLRSQYLAEASAQSARVYMVNPYGWYGPGWYWNPYFSMYSFIPGGFLYSPFGYGFYSPWGYRGPVVIHHGGGFRPSAPRTFGGSRGYRR